MLIKLCDLTWRQRRSRPPYLVGHVRGFRLLAVGRHEPAPGEPDFTLLIGGTPTDDRRALPPVWDDVHKRWIGPTWPGYPGGEVPVEHLDDIWFDDGEEVDAIGLGAGDGTPA